MSSTKTIRWGILGTGFTAGEFAQGLQSLPDARLYAVSSRTFSNAQTFAQRFKVPKAYGSYEELVNDPAVDVVYVATPNDRHKADCLLSLNADKPVLCEKPFTINAQEAREVINLARQKQLFCMEAMWMRCMPLIQNVQELVKSGAIGEVCTLTAEFGYPAAFDPKSRFFNREAGGGALLDRGIYLLSLAFYLLGKPSQIVSQPTIGKSGVDEQSAILLRYPQGQLAILLANLRTYASNEATITGTRGKIQIHAPFYKPHQITLTKFPEVAPAPLPSGASSPGLKKKVTSYIQSNAVLRRLYFQFGDSLRSIIRPSSTTVEPYIGNGYNYEAAEVMQCLRKGVLESPIMPLDETLSLMETMDEIRREWNLVYPQDQ